MTVFVEQSVLHEEHLSKIQEFATMKNRLSTFSEGECRAVSDVLASLSSNCLRCRLRHAQRQNRFHYLLRRRRHFALRQLAFPGNLGLPQYSYFIKCTLGGPRCFFCLDECSAGDGFPFGFPGFSHSF